jgi:hypothetical protein
VTITAYRPLERNWVRIRQPRQGGAGSEASASSQPLENTAAASPGRKFFFIVPIGFG